MSYKGMCIFGSVIGLLIALLLYFVTNNIYSPIVFAIIYYLDFFLLLGKKTRAYFIKRTRIQECHHFINSFVISLSINDSLLDAYEYATKNPSKAFLKEIESLNDLPIEERLVYLRRYFNLSIYKMFINVINIHSQQGGKILNSADTLLQESTRMEQALIASTAFNFKKALEFISLWGMTFLILIFLRIGLRDFYNSMLTSSVFLVLVFAFFLFVIISMHIFINNLLTISIKEDEL